MKKRCKFFDERTYVYGTGCYFLGVSIVFFLNLLINIPWYLNLFCLFCFLPMGMLLISKSKRLEQELRKEKKKSRRKKDDKRKKVK